MFDWRTIKTKTFLGALAGIITGVALVVEETTRTEGILMIWGSLQTIFLRDAVTKANGK